METVKKTIHDIQLNELGHTYQIYVLAEQTKDTKKYYNYNPIIEGKRCYTVYHQIVYALDIKKELKKQVIKFEIKQEEHVNVSFDMHSSIGVHNVYYLYVERLNRGNKGVVKTISQDTIPYKPEELKGRRFCL